MSSADIVLLGDQRRWSELTSKQRRKYVQLETIKRELSHEGLSPLDDYLTAVYFASEKGRQNKIAKEKARTDGLMVHLRRTIDQWRDKPKAKREIGEARRIVQEHNVDKLTRALCRFNRCKRTKCKLCVKLKTKPGECSFPWPTNKKDLTYVWSYKGEKYTVKFWTLRPYVKKAKTLVV